MDYEQLTEELVQYAINNGTSGMWEFDVNDLESQYGEGIKDSLDLLLLQLSEHENVSSANLHDNTLTVYLNEDECFSLS